MKKLVIVMAAAVVVAVGYWLLSPLFLDVVVQEGLPTGSGYDLPADAQAPEPVLLATGTFMDGDTSHHGSGKVSIIRIGRQEYVRFEEDFAVTNGPDLFVYLGKDGKIDKALSLGELKGNKGSQNYAIPVDASILDTNQIIIWCRAFDVNFAVATLEKVAALD